MGTSVSYNKTLSNRYKVVISSTASSKRDGLAEGVYAGRIQTPRALRLFQQNEVLSEILKDKKINIKRNLVSGFIIAALIASIGSSSAHATSTSADHLRLYAHSRIIDWKEFQCFNHIIHKESRWNPRARNGSHYGLGQMRSVHYGKLDPYRQIDATLAYITKRYKGICKAARFHDLKGYY